MIAMSLQTVVLLVLIIGFPLESMSCVKEGGPATPVESQNGKEKVSTMSPQDVLRVKEAADHFIARFRETLDFGILFDEAFVTHSIQRLRKAEFFKSLNISPQLIENLDDQALERAYKAFMNYYYLKAVFGLGVGKSESTPQEVTAAIKVSKFSNLLSDEGSGDSISITTRQQLDEFVNDLSKIAALYKGHLSQDIFDSPNYKTGLKAINKQRRIQVRDGYESLCVEKGTKVYELQKDIFTFFFIEENGLIRVLTLGIGD